MTLDRLTIVLPWPDSRLMPNHKNGGHWAGTQDAKARARMDGAMSAKQAMGRNVLSLPDQIPVKITFAAPDRIRRDLDNLHGAMKASLDGIAKALGLAGGRAETIHRKNHEGRMRHIEDDHQAALIRRAWLAAEQQRFTDAILRNS